MYYYGLIMMIGNEMAPTSLGQYIFTALTTLLGNLFMMFMFGSIAATIASMNQRETRYEDVIETVQLGMRTIKLPPKK